MLQGILNWFRQNTRFIFDNDPLIDSQAIPTTKTNLNKTYLIDASAPSLIIEKLMPTSTALPMTSQGESGGGYALGTSQQQAAGLKQIVNEALVYMMAKSPKKIAKWAATSNISLVSRAGTDINAFYDRKALKFFYFTDKVRKKTVFACDSRTVVSHEFGHALLDILRPDLWNLVSDEIWAFHEAFGDMVAMINSLQYEALIDEATKETTDLTKSSVLTRLAADMGIGLYGLTGGKSGELKNCLRDISQKFQYVSPSSLPSDGRDDQIVNEPHSFSRVFSSMFWYILVQVANSYILVDKLAPKSALVKARDTMSVYLLVAVSNASANNKFFRSVCQEIMIADKKAGGRFQNLFMSIFVEWKMYESPIKMLSKLTYDDVIKNIDQDFEYQDHGTIKALHVGSSKTIKLSDSVGVASLAMNPLFSAEIEVAAKSSYYFDENMILQEAIESTEAEILQSATNCLNLIDKKNWLGESDKAQFELVDGKLQRTKIAACGCNKPNYCIPGSPEYQKPWKPKNNAGCIKCRNKNCLPKSCDCTSPTPPAPPKTGCYTTSSTCKTTSIRVGNKTSRKVC